ncbi:MAG TPA: helix-turn-helix transcriptional regulator [Steroidobacteraceae bacterium]|nr:helix-turn-helix transcriptional regulator [Steroidobacteraceae bacterium]
MDTSYAVRQLAQTLKEARVARGFTQRELAELAGFGQNRLALIEAGQVDLRTSTLVQLARALDLELVLTPRRVLPAVQSLTGNQASRWQDSGRRSVRGTPIRVLRHIQQHIAALERTHLSSDELTKVKSAVEALINVGSNLGFSTLQPLRRSVHWLALARANTAQAKQPLAKAAAQLQELYQTLPAMAHLEQTSRVQRAAYSLEDETS